MVCGYSVSTFFLENQEGSLPLVELWLSHGEEQETKKRKWTGKWINNVLEKSWKKIPRKKKRKLVGSCMLIVK